MTLNQKCEDLDINEGHLYHEERASLKKISRKKLFEVLGENAAQAHTNCFKTEEDIVRTNLNDL